MMDDLLNEVVMRLNSSGYIAEERCGDVWVQFQLNGNDIQLICKLGPFFPYEIPMIYVSEETSDRIPAMPHRYTDKGICTYDRSIAIPNFNKPVELVIEVVDKAKKIIQEGLVGANIDDYMEEFLAYWETRKHEKVQLFVDDLTSAKPLYCIKGKYESIAADTKDKLQELCAATLGWDDFHYIKGMLIPTDGNINMSIPRTDIDFIRLVKNNSKYWEILDSFIQKNITVDKFFVIVAEKQSSDLKLFGWLFHGPGIPDGFRKGHVKLPIAFNRTKTKGMAIFVNNCNQERLFTRGGDGKEMLLEEICIVGCGSVGSYVAEAFMNCGAKKFTLVDNDILTYENIARHYAGYSYVDSFKTRAVASKMRFHNPNVMCNTFEMNAHEFFRNNMDLVNCSDLFVLAVASISIEDYVVNMINSGNIVVPTLVIWVEPYAIAGHAILINKPIDIYCELFDKETLEYQYKVVENPEKYNKREAGCQSSYMPYSALSVKNMIFRILEPCIKDYLPTGNSFRFTWCGRLSEAREQEIKITDHYSDCSDYTVEVERLN